MISSLNNTLFLLSILGIGASFSLASETQTDQSDTHYSLIKALEYPCDVSSCLPVVIIGGGNAGLSAALYTAREHIKTLVIMGEQPGGLLVESSLVDNIPGIIAQPGKNVMDTLQQRALEAGASLVYAGVHEIDLKTWPYTLALDNGDTLNALTVIIATGATPKYLDIPGEESYKGRGISTCALCDGSFFKNKDVIVIGGGNSAVEQAIHLVAHARSVTIIHRSASMRATPSIYNRLKHHKNISVLLNTKLREIGGDELGVTYVITENTQTGEQALLNTQGVFLAIGHEPRTHLFKEYLPCDAYGALITRNNGPETDITGVFAAGDVVDTVYRQAITAQGMGAQAAILATRFLQSLGFTQETQEQLKPYEPEVFSSTNEDDTSETNAEDYFIFYE